MLHTKSNLIACTAAVALLALAGCATPLSPPSPSVAIPKQWNIAAPPATVTLKERGNAWWRDFGSAELDQLVEATLTANQDMHIATARVAQARALVDGSMADRLPQLSFVAGTQRGQDSAVNPKTNASSAGFRASWEIDLFSGKAFASAAAAHDAQSAELLQQAARVTLAAEVATAYFDIQALLRRKAVTHDSIATLERQIAVAHRRHKAGHLSTLAVDRFESALWQEKALAQQLKGELQIRQRQLGLLLGQTQAADTLPWTGWDRDDVAVSASLLPADLLERRPDVQRYARALDAATARTGVARADLYPRIQFEWAGRKEHLNIQGTDSKATNVVLGYGVALSLPIFDGGRIRSNIAIQEARVQEAMAEYEKAMLEALADVDIAFVQFRATQVSMADLERARNVSADAVRKSERMFEAGLMDLSGLLDVRRNYLQAQDALLQARNQHWSAAVAVRRAFAGGV